MPLFLDITYFLLSFFLLTACFITAFIKSVQIVNKVELRKEFISKPLFYVFPNFIARLFPDKYWRQLNYLLSTSRTLPVIFFTLFFSQSTSLFFSFLTSGTTASKLLFIFIIGFIAALILLLFDFIIHLLTSINPIRTIRLVTPLVSLIGLLLFPFTFALLKIYTYSQKHYLFNKHTHSSSKKVKDEVLELLHESEISDSFLNEEKKLIGAVVALKQKRAKEVMIPRVDMVALDEVSSLDAALTSFIKHGHSRIPIFNLSIDNIVGILYFKDVANFLFNHAHEHKHSDEEQTVKSLMRAPFFTPESKKIHHLLHELRVKKVHLAIIVDEYGGTEGIVSIEDILEELVGEIDDEHDKDLPPKVSKHEIADKGFIVDGKMTILDLEKQLGISLPHQNNYDTIGGYVFYLAGTIPKQGWKMHGDNFDIEILSSNERFIEKILITPR